MNALTGREVAKITGLTMALLLVPLVAMQLTGEVNWGVGDFVVAGALLFGAGAAYTLAARRTRTVSQRLAVGALVLLALGTVWAELAVGLFT